MRFYPYAADTCDPLKKAWKNGDVELTALTRLHYPGSPIPPQMLKGINSIGYWDTHIHQDWGLDWHRNEGLEITFLETGSLAFAIEGQQDVLLHANDLTITRPWQLHKVGNPCVSIGRLYWIILDVEIRQPHQSWRWPEWLILSKKDMDEITINLRQNEQPVWHTNQEINRCFQEIGKAVKDNFQSSQESKLAILINELFLGILQLFRKGEILLDKGLMDSMRSAESFLAELSQYLERNWTLDSMAEHCGLGTTRFVHYCKQITNMTPMQYLNYLRLKASAQMLKNEASLNVVHIAYDCGFATGQYFATLFKKQYGCTPGQYRSASQK